MGLLDDAIREHLELKRAHGADEGEIRRLEQEALGPPRSPGELAAAAPAGEPAQPAAVPEAEAPPELPAALEHHDDDGATEVMAAEAVLPEPEPEPEPRLRRVEETEPWLDEPDEVPREEALQHEGEEDVLEETPEFLQETPEHDRLWFEQKPPRGFDFDK